MWYLYLNKETAGPYSQEELEAMIEGRECSLVDYAWTEGMMKWARLLDIDEFAGLMPSYPKTGIPKAAAPETAAPAAPVVKKKSVRKTNSEQKQPKAEKPSIEAQEIAAVMEKIVPIMQKATENAEPIKVPKAAPAPEWDRNRDFSRQHIDAKVVIENDSCEVINISEGGIFVKTKNPLPVGTELEFTLVSAHFSDALQMRGVVIRQGFACLDKTVKEVGFAIEFVRMNPIHRRLINQFIDECNSEAMAS